MAGVFCFGLNRGTMVPKSESTQTLPDKWFWLFLSWVLACLALYFREIPPHPVQSFRSLLFSFETSPWSPTQVAQAWVRHLFLILTFAGTLVVFMGSGARLLKWVNPLELSPVEKWVWSLALGWVFWGLLAEGLAFEKL